MITKMLNKEETLKIFEEEAILLDGDGDNVIPFHKAIELFGEEAAIFFERNMGITGYFKAGEDYNGMGACSDERPMIWYLYKWGFYKLVAEHNYLLTVKAHKESEGGHIWDKVWEERSRRLDEEDAEYERKREERRKKRAAARAAKKKEEEEKNNK